MITCEEKHEICEEIKKTTKGKGFVLVFIEYDGEGLEVVSNMKVEASILLCQSFITSIQNGTAIKMDTN